jgi:dTDP-4-dehydrorhamnose 3,5-epimerase-like enzyme
MSLSDKIQLIDRSLLKDERGWFLKVLTGNEDFLPAHIGEAYMTMAKPGEWRANHYHPLTAEWFTVFQGEAKVILEDVQTHERMELTLLADKSQTLFVPPGIAHVFINSSLTEEMLLIAYAANKYDPKDTVMYNLGSTK